MSVVACAMDTPVEMSGLKYDEVCKWTAYDWQNAKRIEKIEALYLLIDEADENVDAGLSARASVDGFDEAFDNASQNTTLLDIFNSCSVDEVTTADYE